MTPSHTPAREQLAKLAEALYRFAQSLDSAFAAHLRDVAVDLAGALPLHDQKTVAGILARARGIVALGERVHALAAGDVAVIVAAIDRAQGLALPVPAKVAPSVAAFEEIATETRGTLEAKPVEVMPVMRTERVPVPAATPAAVQTLAATPRAERIASATISVMAAPAANDRQARIVSVIRQNPEARMRDLLAALPGVSERTIRYDIERLVASGSIVREGVGGPATRYRVQ